MDKPAASYRDALADRAAVVWTDMKSRTVSAIDAFYERGSAEDAIALRHALIINANLDLNRPDDKRKAPTVEAARRKRQRR